MNFNLKITYEEPVQSGKITLIKAHGVIKLDGQPISSCETTGQSVCDSQDEFNACEGITRAKESAARKLNIKAVKYMKWFMRSVDEIHASAQKFIDEANAEIATIVNE